MSKTAILPRAAIRMPYVFDVARARTTNIASPTSAIHGAIDPLSVEAPSAFVGIRKDCEIRTGRYPTTLLASGVKFSAPDFGAYVEPTRGRRWVACPKRQSCLVRPSMTIGSARSHSQRRPDRACIHRNGRPPQDLGLEFRQGCTRADPPFGVSRIPTGHFWDAKQISKH